MYLCPNSFEKNYHLYQVIDHYQIFCTVWLKNPIMVRLYKIMFVAFADNILNTFQHLLYHESRKLPWRQRGCSDAGSPSSVKECADCRKSFKQEYVYYESYVWILGSNKNVQQFYSCHRSNPSELYWSLLIFQYKSKLQFGYQDMKFSPVTLKHKKEEKLVTVL